MPDGSAWKREWGVRRGGDKLCHHKMESELWWKGMDYQRRSNLGRDRKILKHFLVEEREYKF